MERHGQIKRARLRRSLGAAVSLAVVTAVITAGPAVPSGAAGCGSGTFSQGPRIPLVGSSFVAQGLAYWPQKDWLIGSYYGPSSAHRIAVVSRSTGRTVKLITVMTPAGDPVSGHMGGASVGAGYLWLSTAVGSKNLFGVPLGAVERASGGAAVRATIAEAVSASSFNSFFGGRLYVGSFNETRSSSMYSYLIGSNGRPMGRSGPITVPAQAQGVAVTSSSYIFSTSFGRRNPSTVRVVSRAGRQIRCFTLPSLSEGIVVAGGRVWVTFEAGSTAYDDYDTGRPGVQPWPSGARALNFRSAPLGSVG